MINCCPTLVSTSRCAPCTRVLDRHIDMAVTGQRHAFLGKYTVGYSAAGKILALDMKLYCNAGNSLDLSHAIMDRALFHSDGAYKIPNIRLLGGAPQLETR